VKRLASLIEYSFHTHEHDDHIDYQLTRALLDAGQTVIVTASNKEMWRDRHIARVERPAFAALAARTHLGIYAPQSRSSQRQLHTVQRHLALYPSSHRFGKSPSAKLGRMD